MEQKQHSSHRVTPRGSPPAKPVAPKLTIIREGEVPRHVAVPPPAKPKKKWPFPHVALAAAALGVREIAANHAITWPAVALLAVALIADVLWLMSRGQGPGVRGQ